MLAFAVAWGPRHNRRYLYRPVDPVLPQRGWRPLAWTRDTERADKWDAFDEAKAWAIGNLRGADWQIVGILGRPNRNDLNGGTPVAISA